MPKGSVTDWEAGNDLADLQDRIGHVIGELKESHPALVLELDAMRLRIGTLFNSLKAHGFSLPDEASKMTVSEK